MLKLRPEEAEVAQANFLLFYHEAIERAISLMGGRSRGYNATTPIEHYFLHGAQDLVYELHKKVLRLENLVTGGGTESQGSVEDNALDLINYAAFLYALLQVESDARQRGEA